MNRMQDALLNEEFRLVADGYVSVEDIDISRTADLARPATYGTRCVQAPHDY